MTVGPKNPVDKSFSGTYSCVRSHEDAELNGFAFIRKLNSAETQRVAWLPHREMVYRILRGISDQN